MELNFNSASFEVVVLDDDLGRFSFYGPMSNDSQLDQLVVRLNDFGRHLRLLGPVNNAVSAQHCIVDITRDTGYCYVYDVIWRGVRLRY